jgi:Flp pilus assembly protein TadG
MATVTHPPWHLRSGSRRRRLGAARGQGMMELVLIMPFAVLLLLGTVEFARLHLIRVSLAGAAHAGVLYASQAKGAAEDTKAVEQYVLTEFRGPESTKKGTNKAEDPKVKVTIIDEGAADGYGKPQVDVTVDLKVATLFNLPGFAKNYDLRARASARILTAETRT